MCNSWTDITTCWQMIPYIYFLIIKIWKCSHHDVQPDSHLRYSRKGNDLTISHLLDYLSRINSTESQNVCITPWDTEAGVLRFNPPFLHLSTSPSPLFFSSSSDTGTKASVIRRWETSLLSLALKLIRMWKK